MLLVLSTLLKAKGPRPVWSEVAVALFPSQSLSHMSSLSLSLSLSLLHEPSLFDEGPLCLSHELSL